MLKNNIPVLIFCIPKALKNRILASIVCGVSKWILISSQDTWSWVSKCLVVVSWFLRVCTTCHQFLLSSFAKEESRICSYFKNVLRTNRIHQPISVNFLLFAKISCILVCLFEMNLCHGYQLGNQNCTLGIL